MSILRDTLSVLLYRTKECLAFLLSNLGFTWFLVGKCKPNLSQIVYQVSCIGLGHSLGLMQEL